MPTCRNVGQLDSADSLYSGGNIFFIAMVIIYVVWPVERYWGVPESQLSQLLSIINYYHLHPYNYDDEYDCPVTRYRGVQVLQSLSISMNYYQSLSSYSP